jgi:hypothetical protein
VEQVVSKFLLAASRLSLQRKRKAAMRTIFGIVTATAAGVLMLSTAAFAGPGTDPNPTNGNDNGYHAGQVNPGAQCGTGAASGAFGAFSHGYVPTTYPDPHTRAADGTATGIANSSICGNRANAPGQLP